MKKYVIEGKLHKSSDGLFVETERDKYGNSLGTWLDELIDDNCQENKYIKVIIYASE